MTSIAVPKKHKSNTVYTGKMYVGPIPSSQELQNYENIIPGAADRILKMAEAQAKHRQELENQNQEMNFHLLDKNLNETRRGQIFAFVIALISLAASSFRIINDYKIRGLLSGMPLTVIICAFCKDNFFKRN